MLKGNIQSSLLGTFFIPNPCLESNSSETQLKKKKLNPQGTVFQRVIWTLLQYSWRKDLSPSTDCSANAAFKHCRSIYGGLLRRRIHQEMTSKLLAGSKCKKRAGVEGESFAFQTTLPASEITLPEQEIRSGHTKILTDIHMYQGTTHWSQQT